MTASDKRLIGLWLSLCCVLVFSMIVLGGVTRLTQSGLSMVEWEPIMGVVPPLTEAEWLQAFKKYQAYPEYQLINKHMVLADFKTIFYVEYAHRVLGRLIGVVFLIPFLLFLFMRKLDGRLAGKLLLLFVLGGAQGLLGWYMVQSGLIDNPRVSPYRLTAHLMLAVFILGYMLWLVFGLLQNGRARPDQVVFSPVAKYYAWAVVAAVVVMIFTGGFVAGTKAGYAFNTFPKMFDHWVPDGMWVLQPIWRNLFENIATVQFIHRCMALFVTLLTIGFWHSLKAVAVPKVRISINMLLVFLAFQVVLGIATLLYVVPVPLAAAHQGGALVLFGIALFIAYQFYRAEHAVRLSKTGSLVELAR